MIQKRLFIEGSSDSFCLQRLRSMVNKKFIKLRNVAGVDNEKERS